MKIELRQENEREERRKEKGEERRDHTHFQNRISSSVIAKNTM